jgi:hypothetical protein
MKLCVPLSAIGRTFRGQRTYVTWQELAVRGERAAARANRQATPKSSARQPAAAGATASGAAWPSDRLPHPCWP